MQATPKHEKICVKMQAMSPLRSNQATGIHDIAPHTSLLPTHDAGMPLHERSSEEASASASGHHPLKIITP
jgi:hypothetical protein